MPSPSENSQRIEELENTIEELSSNILSLRQENQELFSSLQTHKHDNIDSLKLNDEISSFVLSFESGEQGAVKIYFPFPARVEKIRGIVVKALSGTDDGTIKGSNSSGDSSDGTLTFPKSSSQGTEKSTNPSDKNEMGEDDWYKLTPSKSTAGGIVVVTLQYRRISQA